MRDQQYLNRLRDYYARHHAFPAMASLCGVVGLSSPSSVFALVGRLTETGHLSRVEGRVAPGRRFFERQLLSSVRAGEPEQAPADDLPDGLNVDQFLVPTPSRTVLLKVKGDSMKQAGLLEGDIVLVERGAPAEVGDVVVAIVDGAPTVKLLAKDNKGFHLKAANPEYSDIRPKERLELYGLVTGSIRKYR